MTPQGIHGGLWAKKHSEITVRLWAVQHSDTKNPCVINPPRRRGDAGGRGGSGVGKHVSKQVDVYQEKYDLKAILRPTEILTPSLQSNAPLQPTLTSEPSFEEGGRQEVFPTELKRTVCLLIVPTLKIKLQLIQWKASKQHESSGGNICYLHSTIIP